MAENKFAKYTKGMKFTTQARSFAEYINAIHKFSEPSTVSAGETKFVKGSDRPTNKVNTVE